MQTRLNPITGGYGRLAGNITPRRLSRKSLAIFGDYRRNVQKKLDLLEIMWFLFVLDKVTVEKGKADPF